MTDLVRLIVDLLRSVWAWVVWLSPVKVIVIEDGEKGARKTFGKFGTETLDPGTYVATSCQVIESDAAIACEASPNGRVECFTEEGTPVDVWAVAAYDVTDYPANARVDGDTLATQVLEAALVDVFARLDIRAAVGPVGRLRPRVRAAMQKRADALTLGIKVRVIEITGRQVAEPAVLRSLNLANIERLIAEGSLTGADATAIVAGAIPTVVADSSK